MQDEMLDGAERVAEAIAAPEAQQANAPESAELPDARVNPDAPEAQDTPETQEAPDAIETPEAPEAQETPEASQPEAVDFDDPVERARLEGATEALLFVSDEPLPSNRLAQVLDITQAQAEELLDGISARLAEEGRGVQLLKVAGGWRLYSHPAYHEVIERYVLSWDTRRLSQAALEALAVIAYGQPVTRQAVNAIRGVNSDGVIASLIEKGLVREMGRDNTPGAPILYGTTRAFFEKFGLADISDLPALEDFAPDDETRELIRDRLSGKALEAQGGEGGGDAATGAADER